ncbi:hypothetical protein LCGC14_1896780, partial [marine sediment metagenome]
MINKENLKKRGTREFIDEIENGMTQKERQKVNLLKKELNKLFAKSERIYLSSKKSKELFNTLFNSEPTEWAKETAFLNIITQIPEVMILQHREKGYFLILKENIQVPEYLREILAIEDVIIKHFELIKQFQLHNQIISSKNDEFIIQWVIIDTNKKYWTTLRNGVFEYGLGIIEDPLIIVSTPESTALDYFYQESTALRKLDIKGKRNLITTFEKIRERVFFTGNHPLGNDTNERLLIIGYQKKEKEREEEQKRKQLLKLKKIEKEKRRKQEIIEEREKDKKREKKERFYNRLVSHFEDLTGIYDEIKITDLKKKLPKGIQENYSEILNKNFVALIEEMIMNNDIRARIRGEYLTFIRGEANSKPNLKKER